MYTKREFLVKVKKENYAELLRILGELSVSDDGLIEKNIYLPDTKETYELLVKSGLVEDWSPVEEKPTLVKRGFELRSVQEEEEDVVGSIPLFGGNNMILLIEYLANLTVYFLDTRKKSPGLRFTHAIFKRENLFSGLVDNTLFGTFCAIYFLCFKIDCTDMIGRRCIAMTDNLGETVLESIYPSVFSKGNNDIVILINYTPLIFLILNRV